LKKVYNILFTLVFLLFVFQLTITAQDTVPAVHAAKVKVKILPLKATMFSAAFPGLGQIYNRKYWKIPLVYAGFGGVGYAVMFNSKWYNRYTKAYQDFTDMVPETASYVSLIRGSKPEDYDPVLHPKTYNPNQASWIRDQLLQGVDYYRRYRDLSYIGIAVWYLVSILDANVDASLFDYEVGENLNLTMAPIQVPLNNYAVLGVNITMKINF
jgi:hypothetical protein